MGDSKSIAKLMSDATRIANECERETARIEAEHQRELERIVAAAQRQRDGTRILPVKFNTWLQAPKSSKVTTTTTITTTKTYYK